MDRPVPLLLLPAATRGDLALEVGSEQVGRGVRRSGETDQSWQGRNGEEGE